MKELLAEMPRISNYRNVQAFIKAFKDKAREQYELSRTMTQIPYKGPSFNAFMDIKEEGKSKDDSLHVMEEDFEDAENSTDAAPADQHEDVNVHETAQEGDEDDLYMDELGEEEKLVLQMVEPAKVKGDSQYPPSCIYFAIFGDCKRGIDCKNKGAHNAQAAQRTRKWLQMKLDEQGPRSRDVKLLRRGQGNS